MLAAADGVFHEVKNMVVWVKNPGLGGFYRSAHELCYVFKISEGKHKSNIALGQRNRSNVWRYPSANVFRAGRMQDLADHPTCKNKFMIRDAILDVTKNGDIVLDSFLQVPALPASHARWQEGARGWSNSTPFTVMLSFAA